MRFEREKLNGHLLICPHCRAAANGMTLSLFWNFNDHCWQCVICGFRGYEPGTVGKKSGENSGQTIKLNDKEIYHE